MAGRKSSANVTLTFLEWSIKLKLMRVQVRAEAPEPQVTHTTCRSEIEILDSCNICATVNRQTGAQKNGVARERPATAPARVYCMNCSEELDNAVQVRFCGTCEKVVDEVEYRLLSGNKTVRVSREQLDAWQELQPDPKEMRAVGLRLRAMVGSWLRDEAYQVVPDKGNALSFSALLSYLSRKGAALVVHFLISKNFKIGVIYPAKVQGETTLILHTLYSFDEIELEPFDVPTVSDEVVDKVAELLAPLWTEQDEMFEHPQRRAFRELFVAGSEGNRVEVVMHGAIAGESEALSRQIAKSLTPQKETRRKS